jgi:hypothetical protein
MQARSKRRQRRDDSVLPLRHWGKVVSYSRGPKAGTVEAGLKSRLVAVSLFGRDRDWTEDDGT